MVEEEIIKEALTQLQKQTGVSARVIGRKMQLLLANSQQVKQRVEAILIKRPTDTRQAMLGGLLE